MNKLREFFNRPVTFGLLTKFIITLNIVAICIGWRFAYISDLEEEEEQEYIEHLEERIDTQRQLIDLLWEDKFGTTIFE